MNVDLLSAKQTKNTICWRSIVFVRQRYRAHESNKQHIGVFMRPTLRGQGADTFMESKHSAVNCNNCRFHLPPTSNFPMSLLVQRVRIMVARTTTMERRVKRQFGQGPLPPLLFVCQNTKKENGGKRKIVLMHPDHPSLTIPHPSSSHVLSSPSIRPTRPMHIVV